MSELLTIDVERLPGVSVARVLGELDASNAIAAQGRLIAAVDNKGAGLVIDLTETRYLDSAGIRILFDTGERLQVRGMELRVVAAPDSFIADVLATVRMAERFAVDDAPADAVAALRRRLPRERTTD